jgi:hypothetical protein
LEIIYLPFLPISQTHHSIYFYLNLTKNKPHNTQTPKTEHRFHHQTMAPAKTLSYLSQQKTLESSFVREEDERPKVAYNNFSNEIPIISLAGIDEVDGRRTEICNKIVEACENWGIFQVVDHGVDTKLVSEMTRFAREFFALPPEEKLRFDMSGGKKGGFIVSSHLQVTKTFPILSQFSAFIFPFLY